MSNVKTHNVENTLTHKQARLKEHLESLVDKNPTSLQAEVAAEALDYTEDDLFSFFTDLLAHGCQSGMVSGLIYYTDTHAFYDKHYDEIEAIRYDLEESFGQPLKPEGDLKNWFAWLAFEETARAIADEFLP